MNNSFLVDEKGFYGEFGGAYVPEILYATVENLRREYLPIIDSEDFRKEWGNNTDSIVRYYSGENFSRPMLRYGYAPPHPSLYCRRELFNIYGTYKNDYAIAADFEFMVRLLSHECVISLYLPLNMVTMRTGGISSRPHNRIIVNTREMKRALKENGVEASYAHLIKLYVTKVRQYISAYSTVDNASSIFKTLRYCTSQETSLHTPRKASSVLR